MFTDNKYYKWYLAIITKRQNLAPEGYSETHHIVPSSLGGSNDKANLVKLTAREHFICHVLLTKFTTGSFYFKMMQALMMMKGFQNRDRYLNSRLYNNARELFAKLKSERMKGEGNHRWGVKANAETCAKIKAAALGKVYWNNGIKSIKAREWPGEGWTAGRILTENYKQSPERRAQNSKFVSENGSWWNNGVKNKRSKLKPEGDEWVAGRLFYKSSNRFTTDKEYLVKWKTFTLRNINTAEELVLGRAEFKEFKQHNKIGGGLKPRKRGFDKDVSWVLIARS